MPVLLLPTLYHRKKQTNKTKSPYLSALNLYIELIEKASYHFGGSILSLLYLHVKLKITMVAHGQKKLFKCCNNLPIQMYTSALSMLRMWVVGFLVCF